MIADPGCRSRPGACSGTNGMPTFKVAVEISLFSQL